MWKFVKTTVLALGVWAVVLGVHAQTCGLRDNGDGTMTDPGTGLQIRKCAEGQSWAGGRCSGSWTDFTFDSANQRFGKGEWRLITKEEAEQMMKRSHGCNLVNTWTSTRKLGKNNSGWNLYPGSGRDAPQLSDDFNDSGTSPVHLVRTSQVSGGISASSSNTQATAPAQNTQQATVQQQPAQNRQPSRDRSDLMGQGCDVGQGTTVQNGCSQTIHYVMCIVRHPDGRTTGANTCQGGQFISGSLSPQESRRVVFGEGSTDYLVAACRNPARPYNFSYSPSKGISTFCRE